MTDAMVEAVARAICRTRTVPENENNWDHYAPAAGAAIIAYEQALSDAGLVVVPREPTEAMLQAADPTMGNLGWRWEQMAGFWRRMISASAAQNTTGKDE